MTISHFLLTWAQIGWVVYLITLIDIGHSFYPTIKKVGLINLVDGSIVKSLIKIFIYYSIMGPIGVYVSIIYSKALSNYKELEDKEVSNSIYGKGKAHCLYIQTTFKEPKVWVKFYNYPDPMLIQISQLIIITKSQYEEQI